MWVAILLLVGLHFVADWGLQNPWMADNKGKFTSVMAAHCAIYTVIMSYGFMKFFAFYPILPVVLFCTHWVIDLRKCRLCDIINNSSKMSKEAKIRYCDALIWLDQVLHLLVILALVLYPISR